MSKKRESKTIQVALRIRPPNENEVKAGDPCSYIKVNKKDNAVCLGDGAKPFNFHHIFDRDTRQEEVFEKVAHQAVLDAFDGYHGLLFVYGQTGTGKTFTISNQQPGMEGVLQRSLNMVFDRIAADRSGDFEVGIQFIQIYQEVISDLLAAHHAADHDRKGYQLRDDPDVEGAVYVSHAHTEPVYRSGITPKQGVQNALACFQRGDKNRVTAGTKMNAVSSRSHTVFTLFINRRNRITEADYDSGESKEEFKGRLILVDLAGSERQKKTGAEGNRLAEANSINGSLLVLGKVIKALTDPKQFVPYRESKLTRLLQYSLAGHGKTSIIVTVGPSETNHEETKSAAEFGQRAMTIKQDAKKHVEIDYKLAYFKLKARLEQDQDEAHANALEELRAEHEVELEQREDRIRELEAHIRVLEADGRGSVSPIPSARSPASPVKGSAAPRKGAVSPAAAPAAGGAEAAGSSSADVRKYKERVREVEKWAEGLKEEKDKQAQALLKAVRSRQELQNELVKLKTERDQAISDKNQLALKLRNQLMQKQDKIEQLMYVIGKVREDKYVSGTADVDDIVSADLLSPRQDDHIDTQMEAGMTPDEQIERLMACVSKLRQQKMIEQQRAEEAAVYHDKAKKAIKLQAQGKMESDQRLAELEAKLEQAEARKRELKGALSELKARFSAS
eukprot:TRINITY_DN399_c3_g1_i1.p1 TRINITY_DN399_c3_g1~~TRINITY_DN399_c3_g1_i1.p1  ORF type:complete len:706 (+),score=239.51 TRINITY_DN399_c3_g1_i1:91-2118(+)